MERVWSQYERMESELSVIRSHLQHICNFGGPQVFVEYELKSYFDVTKVSLPVTNSHVGSSCQEQSHAQRELWMMEDILAGLKINRDHFGFLLGLQTHRSKHQFLYD